MCGGGCNTSQATTAANPDAQAAYTDVVSKAQSVAGTPYQPYGGELVAGLNQGQNRSVAQLQGAYGAAQPYIDTGSGYLGLGAQGLGNVQNYLQAGSDATAGAAGYQGLGAASFGQSGAYSGQSAAALDGMQPYMDAASGAIGTAQGYFGQSAGLATPQDFDAAAIQKYMSPYLSSVVDATQANLQENDRQQAEGLTSSAIGAGAYGGDRAGVAQAELARQQDLADGQTISGLYNQGYSNAENQFNAVQGQRQQGASLLSGLGQGSLATAQGYDALAQAQGQKAQQFSTLSGAANATGSGYAGLASSSLGQASAYGTLGQLQGTTGQAYGSMAGLAGNLGSTAQGTLISGASAGLQGATLKQQNAQQQDTALYNQYMSGLSYPYQNVGFLSNIVQGIGSQEGNTQTTQGNALSSIAGLGTSAIGILGATGGFGSSGYLSGLGSSISSAFSDARVKDDIASIGTTHDGQPIYRFRYKGDPKVQMGLMAQDVEKRDPGAVGEVAGIKTVDYDRATAGAVALGLGAHPGDPRPTRAAGGPVGLGMSPVGGPAMPAPATLGLGARPRFDTGGVADPTMAPIPSGGINTSPSALMAASGINTGGGVGAGRPIRMQPQGGQGGQGLGVLAAAPTSGGAGLGAAPVPSGGSSDGASGGSSGGLSQNAWMGVLAAGLGMMGGTSASATSNIGQGALGGLQTYLGLEKQDKQNAFQRSDLALRSKQADQTATYQAGSLRIDQQRADQTAEQLRQTAELQRQQLAVQSAGAVNAAANTKSEVDARDQQTKIGRYQSVYVPGIGYMVRDLTNPTAPPQVAPAAPTRTAGSPGAAPAAPVPPPLSSGASVSAPAPMPTPSGAGLDRTIPGSAAPMPTPSGAQQPTAPASSGSTPNSASQPSGTGAGWKPTSAAPEGYVPPNQAGIYMNPGVLKGEQENAAKTIEATRGEAQAAGSLQMRLDEMDRQFAQLPKTGLLAPGQGAEARASLAKTVNQYATGIGMQPIFDPNAVAANENLLKDRFRLGADLAKSMGGREPGFIVQQAVKANPGADNTPQAYERITAGLRQASQYQQDRAAFFDDYNARFGHLNGAQQAFDKLNPPQAYANRAVVSTIDPRDVAALQANAKNPAAAAAIDRKYGIGSAAAVMGQ